MFLRKLLAGFAIASLLLMLVVAVLWWRSYHHIDHFGFPGLGGSRAEITSSHGTLMVISTQNTGTMVRQEARFYPHKKVLEGCLMIPALWLAVFIRAKLLPYRPGRGPRLARGVSTSEKT